MSKNEILALIDLLDDPDMVVYQQIRDRLLKEGMPVVKALEGAWVDNFEPLRHKRIENIVHQIQYQNVKGKLTEWSRIGGNSIYRGALLVAQYQYPYLDENEIVQQIDKLKNDIWLELNDNLTAFEKVKVFNHILFQEYGFKGDKEDYHNPRNSYINKVLESKKGNPLSLSVLYMILAEKLDVPIKGVNLPEHFILAYKDEYNLLSVLEGKELYGVMFYINPFSNGQVFGKKDVDEFLRQLNVNPEEKYYKPCDNVQIIARMLNNLQYSYKKLNKEDKAKEIGELIKCIIKAKK